ncbi:hypothetical protein RBB79_15295 [Tunturiibacter empetritectus]|uniref:Uncharacterized protein n=1 Tax=Tunturiibacter lichenicola TaxID=2051959 RepID=A0A852VIM0_9BACT|nr:hypothetical protein [Edaphobacter lichenicola]NYF90979.1 hypothetical protein [Edaphobacter lichenicola]
MNDRETNSSQTAHAAFLRKAANHTEALSNLIYLICEEAEHPAKVRHYASLSEHSLQALTQLLREQI